MSVAAQPLTKDDGPLSPWWIRGILIVMAIGFSGLAATTLLAYRNAPPIPERTVDPQGNTLFSAEDIREGQAVFLKYGLMANGSIWGHGAYFGPDFSAEALHRMGEISARSIAWHGYGQPLSALTAQQQAAVQAEAAVILKDNRYNEATGILGFTEAQAGAYRREILHWTHYFRHPARNGGLMLDLVTDPIELQQFTAFVTWTAWASVAARPGEDYSYTNNFPYDPSVWNYPTSDALLWSALSLIVILAGTAAVLLAFGRFNYLGWVTRGQHVHPHLLGRQSSPGQRAIVKFFVIVAILFLMQTLAGGAASHYRADPDSFYGFQLERVFPSNLLRTWHLQTAIFWIATAYVAASLFLGRSLRKEEPRWLAAGTHMLFIAFVVVIAGSLLGEWLGISRLLGDWWFWVGNQGWEYLELGRSWQYLLLLGLLVWFAMLFSLMRPHDLAEMSSRPIVRMFLIAALAIPVFISPLCFSVPDPTLQWSIHGASGLFIYGSRVSSNFLLRQSSLSCFTSLA